MTDRITPYDEGGNIAERIDEIVMAGADVHLEMLSDGVFWLNISKGDKVHVFTGFAQGGKLTIRLADIEDLAA